jgi:hypothetical protein
VLQSYLITKPPMAGAVGFHPCSATLAGRVPQDGVIPMVG